MFDTYRFANCGADNGLTFQQKFKPNHYVFPRLFLLNEEVIRDFDEVGSGLSYIVPIMMSLELHNLRYIEQPELHLHPMAQCEIADVLMAGVSGEKSYTGLICESHSEHIILRVSKRIREYHKLKSEDMKRKGGKKSKMNISDEFKMTPEKVITYYFEPHADGFTKVHRIRFDEKGDFLDIWPGGFLQKGTRSYSMSKHTALDPEACKVLRWRDVNFLLDKFGASRGRFLTQYPENWARRILDQFKKELRLFSGLCVTRACHKDSYTS